MSEPANEAVHTTEDPPGADAEPDGTTGVRLRRPVPEREHPVRAAATMFRPAGPARAATDAGPAPTSGPTRGFAERGVDNAYRVLDEYLRRGREAARAHEARSTEGDGMNTNERAHDGRADGATSTASTASTMSVPDLTRKIVRAWSDMLYVWVDLVGPLAERVVADGAARPQGPDSAWAREDAAWREVAPTDGGGSASGSHAAAHAEDGAGGLSIEVEVSSDKPARVQLDLARATSTSALSVPALQSVDGADAPTIAGATLAPGEDGALALVIAVPPGQPAGTYTAAVFDRTSKRAVGTVTLTLRG